MLCTIGTGVTGAGLAVGNLETSGNSDNNFNSSPSGP